MCGIAGLFDIKGSKPFDPEVLDRMTLALRLRGPDGSGMHFRPGVALGHRRLAVIDIDGGAQPMQTSDGRLTVVFNGEIYNFRELRAELQAQGHRFLTRSDTEVLLHGWLAWGQSLLPRLNGMFAFAMYDACEQTLILARDRLGKKPLHYAMLGDDEIAFGSEIKALLHVPDLDRRLDMEAAADFFTYGYIPDPKTIYEHIRKLPPAHVLVAQRGRPVTIRAYWSLLDGYQGCRDLTTDELTDRLREAVRRRLVADVPLGALLSGGVDSSAVVALMSESLSAPRTFSIGFEQSDFDETAYAARVASRYGADHEVRTLNAEDFSLVGRLPEIYDEPFGDVSAIPTFAVCAHARRHVTVALSGDGGDEALGGYRRYAAHSAEEKVRALLPPAMRRPLFSLLARAWPSPHWAPRWFRAGSTFHELSLDPATAYARMVSALHEATRAELLSEDFTRGLGGYDPTEVVRAHFNVDAPLDPLQRAQYADVMTYLPGDILTKVDRASMANSLELRSPMLDPDFFSAAFALPAHRKLALGRGGKAILKAAMESRLPRDLLYRPKRGFTVPLARWFRGPLRDQVLRLGASPNLMACGVVDPAAVTRMAIAHVNGAADHSKALWLVWVFDAFLAHACEAASTAAATVARPRPMPESQAPPIPAATT